MRIKENYYLVLIGFVLMISSCKNETSQPISKEYATLVVKDSSKTLSTSYSATTEENKMSVFMQKYRAKSPILKSRKDKGSRKDRFYSL